MKVLFLTLGSISHVSTRGIYTDLIREFRDRGDEVYVVCPRERRHGKPTESVIEDGINLVRVKTGNITKTNIIEKGISTLLIEWQFIQAIRKHLGQIRFDLLLYSTPPITFERAVKYVKKRDGCKTYLLLKDIFPQNAVDIGMMKDGGLLWRYFRSKEKRLYAISDYIGCMSPANVEYLLRNNREIDPAKVEVCPNSIKPVPLVNYAERSFELRERYGIPQDAVVFIYGGNLGRPQGISFLLNILDHIKDREHIFFLIVGSGTEYGRIENHLNKGHYRNAKLFKSLPKDDYDRLLMCCDVGLIFLDPRFTIPNFPSRLTAYMESAIPITAATDVNTDLKDVIQKAGCGLWVKSGDIDGFIKAIDILAANPTLRQEMGLKGRKYLEQNYTVDKAYDIITGHFAL